MENFSLFKIKCNYMISWRHFACQKSTIKCQQFTKVKFKNVLKQEKIIFVYFIYTKKFYARHFFFLGALKYRFSRHMRPFYFGYLQWKSYWLNSGWNILHGIYFQFGLKSFFQVCIIVNCVLHLEIMQRERYDGPNVHYFNRKMQFQIYFSY